MLVLVGLLWSLFGATLGAPLPQQAWLEAEPPQSPPFHRLPTFLHAPAPLVPPQLFQPVPHKTALPAGLSTLLIPPTTHEQGLEDGGARAVEVWCGPDSVRVRLDRLQLRAWTVPSRFRLGSCQANQVTARYVHFSYGLGECAGESKVVGGQLVYTYTMSYTPPPQGHVIRLFPLNFPIHCHYNRFHYSYQVGFRPQIQHTTLLKSLKSKLAFSLTVCNAQWEPLAPGHSFSLGESVYLMAQAGALLSGERLFVDSCYATSSEDPDGLPRVDIISNFGCMADSRRGGSSSQFLSGGAGVLKFSVDSFLFRGVSQVQYLHCSLSVSLGVSHIAKSCTYHEAAGRWEELAASPSVCSCCESVCSDTGGVPKESRVHSLGWLVSQKDKEPKMAEMHLTAEDDEEKMKVRMDGHHKDLQTSPQEIQTGSEEEKTGDFSEKMKWKVAVVGQPSTSEEGARGGEEPLSEQPSSQLKGGPAPGVMSDEGGPPYDDPAQAGDGAPAFRNDSGRAVFRPRGAEGSGGTADLRNDTSGIGSDEHGAAGPSPAPPPCASCSSETGEVQHEKEGVVSRRDVDAEAFSPQNVTSAPGVRETGRRPPTPEADGRAAPHLRVPAEAGLQSEAVPWAGQIQCVDKVVHPVPLSLPAAGGDDDLQSRGSEPDQPAYSAGPRHLVCEVRGAESDSGKEDEALNQFGGGVKAQKEVSGSLTARVSVGSEHHSAVVTVSGGVPDSGSTQRTDRLWTEVWPGWGGQSSGFVGAQPAGVELELTHRLLFSRPDHLSTKP
ncbi:uncharacterized protein ACNS7B_019368 [Menidia menidia]